MTERERLTKHIESAMYWGYTTPSEIAERTGEIAWCDNENPMERM